MMSLSFVLNMEGHLNMKRFKSLINQFQNVQLIDCKDLKPTTTSNASNTENQPTIIHSNTWTQAQMLDLAASGGHHCFLNTESPLIESELYSSLKIESQPLEFLTNPLPFWFQNESQNLLLPFKKKTDKIDMMRQFEPFLEKTGSKLIQENVRILFQELFMNAVFDAPKEAKKRGITANKKDCEMLFAYDHEKFVISCLDHYGALEPLSMVIRIRDILLAESTKVINFDSTQGGAGIGSSLLFHYSSSLSIIVEEEKSTRVSCTIPLKTGQKKFHLLEKNLQYIKIKIMGGHYEKQRNA